MTFGSPSLLWLLALLPALVLLFFVNEKRARLLLQKIVAARLLPQLTGSISRGKRRLRHFILLLGITSLVVSLARPQIGYTWEQSKRKGRDVLIAIDTSKSMLAADIAPNRLARAKLAAQDLIALLQGDRVGVLAFAGSSFLQAPLTIDYGAALDSINDLDTNTIPLGGTDIAGVIEAAAQAFGKGESEDRALVLFTDGEELSADGVAAARHHEKEFRIFTIGIGSAEGAIIPVPETDGGANFVKDPEGRIVKSRLDEGRLKEIAAASGGFYLHLQNGPAEMKKIVQEGLGKMKERDIDARMARHPIERYQWPLALGLALVAASMFIGERRRAATVASRRTALPAALVLFALLCGSQTVRALSLNEGVDLYNAKKYKEAYDVFQKQIARNPDSQALEFDRGAAAYKTGEYDKAVDAFSKALASSKPNVRGKAEYNLGNTLCLRGVQQQSKETKLKDWTNALQHYDEALKIDPKNDEAKFNRDVVRKLIEDLKKEPPQSKQDQNQQKKDSNQKQDQKKQQNQQNQQDQKKNNQNKENNQDQQQQQQNQSGSKDQNKDESKNDNSQKDQSQQGSKPDEKNQSSKNEQQKQDQSGSPEQNKEQNSGNPNASPENQNGQQNQQQEQQPSQQPTPAPGEEEKKPSGKIEEQKQGEKSENAQKTAQVAPYEPGQERAMTPEEAQRVVEAEKDEEAKGVLIEHKESAPVLKDW